MQAPVDEAAGKLPVLICGGGPVGATLALALARAGIRVGLVEASAAGAPARDAEQRPIALSASSVRILSALDAWAAIARDACPIRMVHVSERGRFGMVRLRAEEQGVDALGYVTDAGVIQRALEPAVEHAPGIVRIRPARVNGALAEGDALRALLEPPRPHGDEPRARLLVAADGGTSGLREMLGFETERREYRQAAVVCTVTPGSAHGSVAYERFTASGPLALLPLASGCCGLVWTLPDAQAAEVAALGEREFLAALQRAFGRRLGTLRAAGPRSSFPLSLVRSRGLTAPRVALAGNAANQLHPVAGQGLNLGLRDAAVLAELVAQAVRDGEDPGGDALLAAYTRQRAADHRAVVRFTDALARGFTAGPPLLGTVRSAAMLALDLCGPARRAFARRAMGLGGRQPRLVRGAAP